MSHPPKDLLALAAVFTTSGTVHLIRPQVFEPLMPKAVPAHREVIYASGVAELVCAAGLLHPRSRRASAWLSLAVLLAVYPANVKMAADSTRSSDTKFKVIAFGRLPVQLPMLWTAYRATRRS